MIDESISRRAFLQQILMGSAALAVPRGWQTSRAADPPLLGRVEAEYEPLMAVLTNPPDQDSRVRLTKYRDVIPIYGALHAGPPFPRYKHNDLWFLTDDGYIHSSYVIPVREIFNEPEAVIGDGFWGEITVPQTRTSWQPAPDSPGKLLLDYGSVFRITERADDETGQAWYRLVDDDLVARQWWVEARYIRRLTAADFAPISPQVPPGDKRIEVSLEEQTLTCFEGSQIVFATRIASGNAYINAEGIQFGFDTPVGEHRILHKRPTRHMAGGDPENPRNYYDLLGVPWCSYFTGTGAAIHGTYWHNNFGMSQSHGCINTPTDAARWLYRWTNPSRGETADFGWDGAPDDDATTITIT